MYSALSILQLKYWNKDYTDLRIFFMQAFTSPISLEIINDSGGIMSQISKINCLATFFKKEHTVKYLKQFSRRLVNPER